MSVDGYCHSDSVITMQYAVTKLYRCAVGIKMKARFQDERGPTKCAKSRRGGSGEGATGPPHFTPLARFGVAAGVILLQDGL